MTQVPLSLVLVHSSDELYGADRILLELAAAAERDFAVEVWLPTDVPHGPFPLCRELGRRGIAYRHLDLPVLRRAYRTPRGLLRLAARVGTVAVALRRMRPDIVYCTTSAALVAAPIARAICHSRIFGHVQEHWVGADRAVLGTLARSCHRMVAVSSSVIGTLPECLARKTALVPNGSPEPQTWSDVSSHRGPLRLVVASRWTPRKGYATLITAFERMRNPAVLTILGGRPPSGDAIDVAALVAATSVTDRVEVVGEVSDIAPYIEEADLVLVPSDEPEAFGLVAIEAFARARPVVASAIGGMLDIVRPGVDGWLFPPKDARALVAILDALDRPALATAGTKAREAFGNRYSSLSFARQWQTVMSEMSGKTDGIASVAGAACERS